MKKETKILLILIAIVLVIIVAVILVTNFLPTKNDSKINKSIAESNMLLYEMAIISAMYDYIGSHDGSFPSGNTSDEVFSNLVAYKEIDVENKPKCTYEAILDGKVILENCTLSNYLCSYKDGIVTCNVK